MHKQGEETVAPRLLVFDLKDSLGPLKKSGYQYESYTVESAKQYAEQRLWFVLFIEINRLQEYKKTRKSRSF